MIVKAKQDKKWVFGQLLLGENSAYLFTTENKVAKIRPKTICYPTGREDSNGNMIYSNDLVHWESKAYSSKQPNLVIYKKEDARYLLLSNTGRLYPIFADMKITIVGNKIDKDDEKKYEVQ